MKQSDIYRFIAGAVPDGIYIVAQENFEYVNEAFRKITGFIKDDVSTIAPKFMKRVHPDDRKAFLERRTALEAGKRLAPYFEIRWIPKQGALKFLQFNTTRVPGRGWRIVGILRDITESKLAQENRKAKASRFKSIIESAKEGIVILQDGIIKYVNAAGEVHSGYPKDEMIHESFHKFVIPEERERVTEMIRRRMSGEEVPFSFDLSLLTKKGKPAFSSINAVEISYEDKLAVMIVIHDRTKEKEMEETIRTTLRGLKTGLDATVQTVIQIVEHRDPYTAGHQRRVADLSRELAVEMGLTSDQCEAIHMAGLLHDVGKISIPSEILTKPTKLSQHEFDLIKTHPQSAYDILSPIAFPWPIAKIIQQHHERSDGSGYPMGLKEGEILIEARILAVADVVEAMITHRPYRAAMSLDEALDEIQKLRGTQFDPSVVDACLALFREGQFSFKPS